MSTLTSSVLSFPEWTDSLAVHKYPDKMASETITSNVCDTSTRKWTLSDLNLPLPTAAQTKPVLSEGHLLGMHSLESSTMGLRLQNKGWGITSQIKMQKKSPPHPLGTFIIAVSGMYSYEPFYSWTGLPSSPCKARWLSRIWFPKDYKRDCFSLTWSGEFLKQVSNACNSREWHIEPPCIHCHLPKPSTIHILTIQLHQYLHLPLWDPPFKMICYQLHFVFWTSTLLLSYKSIGKRSWQHPLAP